MTAPARTVSGILVAAGSGERLGRAVPKGLVTVAGEALVVHALRALASSGVLTNVIVVAPKDYLDDVATLIGRARGDVEVQLCPGGPTRAASVKCGLAALPGSAEVVAVHDAARPLASPGLVARTIAALEPPWEAVAPALPVVDTLKLAAGGRVLQTVDRGGLFAVQTPQVFPRSVLDAAHARVPADDPAATDDLVAVERAGGRVRLIEGERTNLKVTYPEDIVVVEALLGGR